MADYESDNERLRKKKKKKAVIEEKIQNSEKNKPREKKKNIGHKGKALSSGCAADLFLVDHRRRA